MMTSNATRALGFGLALTLLAFPTLAQEASPAESTEGTGATVTSDELADLLAKVKATDTELQEITSAIPESEGEDLTILRMKFGELGSQQATDLYALLDLIGDREKAGGDVELVEQQANQLLKRSSRRLRSYIRSFEDDLQQESLKRASLTPLEAQELEHQMAVDTNRLDELYLSLIQLTDEMVAAGMEVDDEHEFLERRLSDRGETLLEVLQLTTKQLEANKALLKRAPDDSELQARVFAAEERYDSNKTALLATIHMMSILDLDYADLEVRTLELTHQFTPEAFEANVALGLMQVKLREAKTFLKERGPSLLVRGLVIIAILVGFWIVARLVRVFTKRALDKTKISTSALLRESIVRLSGRVVLAIGVILVLSQLGIDLGPVLAGLGIVGLVVGFALQDTLSNFAAGAMILAYRPFDIGDLVETAGVLGKVSDMNLVSTTIMTVDHQTLVVPNSKIWGDVIRNVTAQTTRRVDMIFGISYEDEIPKAERVLQEIVDAHDKVLEDPEPMIKLHTLGDSSVDFIVRPWAKTEDYWDVYWDVTREVKMRFDREGISIPYPQRDVHVFGQNAGDQEG
jgi:small conductance mechanosensitive channel